MCFLHSLIVNTTLMKKWLFVLLCLIGFEAQASDYYWVGGSGDWFDLSHWATSSGGTTKRAVVPTQTDNVFFDANSFTAPGQVVTAPSKIFCKNMDWSKALFNPTFSSNYDLNIYGSMYLTKGMAFNLLGYTYFLATTSVEIATAGNSFLNSILFVTKGSWTMKDSLVVKADVYLNRGTLITSGNALYFSSLYSGATKSVLEAGSSKIYCSGEMVVDASLFTYTKGTSALYMKKTGARLAVTGALDFYDVYFSSDASILGANNFHQLDFQEGAQVSFEASSTQTVDKLLTHGSCHRPVVFRSSVLGTRAFLYSANVQTLHYVDLEDISASGAVFNAYAGVDTDNNDGFTFLPAASRVLYWVGQSGNWSQEAHWSSTSGGTGGECIPTMADDVFVDDQSFNAGGQTISLDVKAYTRDFTWSASTQTGVFSGSYPFYCYGSFRLKGSLNYNHTGTTNFVGTSPQTIDAGKYVFQNDVYLNGKSYSLASALNVPNSPLYLLNGSFQTNSFPLFINRFYATNPNIRSLDLGNSQVRVGGASVSTGDYLWNVNSPNFTLKAGNSSIEFYNSGPAVKMGAGLAYHRLLFSSATGTAVFNGINNKVDSLIMMANGQIKGNNTFGFLKFTPDYTYTLEHSKTQTILNDLQMKGNKCIGVRLKSDVAGSAATIEKTSGWIETDYSTIADSKATGGATFYAGTHSTDAGGNTGWQFIAGPNQSVPFFGSDTLVYFGNSIFLEGEKFLTNGATTYEWYSSVTSPAVSGTDSRLKVSDPARYWLVATYKPGCSIVDSINVYYATISNPSCFNTKDASILITYDNNLSWNLKWSTGQLSKHLLNIQAGDYTFTINQVPNNETFVHTVKMYQPDSLMVDSVKVKPVVGCFGDKTGALTVYVHGGNPVYTYSIDNGVSYSPSSTFTNLKSDSFHIRVKDQNACPMLAKNVFVGQPGKLMVTKLSPVSTCSSKASGSILVETSGGTNPRQYSSDGLTYQKDSLLVNLTSKKYTVKVRDAQACMASDTVSVWVYPKTTVGIRSKDSICKGLEYPIHTDDASNYLRIAWTTSGSGTFSDPSAFHPVYHPASNDLGQYSLSMNVYGVCETVVGTTILQINDLPHPALGGDTTVCMDKKWVLDAGPGFRSYLWNDFSSKSSLTVTKAGKYWVDVVSFSGCANSDTINLSTKPIPSVSLPADTSYCYGFAKTLDPGAGYVSYLWQNGSTNQSIDARVSGSYWVEVSNQYQCKNRDTIRITVYDLPKPSLGADTALCQGTFLTLRPGSFRTYLWQDGSMSSNFKAATTGLYWVEVSDVNKCKNRDSLNLLVTPAPVVNLGADTAICDGDKLLLDAGAGFQTYLWNNGSIEQTQLVTNAGTYSVTVKGLAACKTTSTRKIIVNPVATVDLGNDTTICVNTRYTLKVPSYYSSYRWQNNWRSDTMVIAKEGYYWLEVTNKYGCPYRDTIAVGVEQYPDFSIGKDTSICFGQAIYLSPGPGFKSYLWSTKDTVETIRVAATDTYTVTVGNRCGFTKKSMRLNVWPVPVADAGLDRKLCLGDTISLKASGGISSVWSNGATGDTTFVPTKTQTYSVIVSDGRCAAMDTVQIIVSPRPTISSVDVNIHGDLVINPGTGIAPFTYSLSGRTFTLKNKFYSLPQGYYTVHMKDSTGCIAGYDSVFVKPSDEVFIPSVFTPNGDGQNDIWEIPGLKDKENVLIQIFDQHGMLLVQYSGKEPGWDGKYHNVDMPSDAYWYLISINKQKYKTGYVAIKR